MLVGREKEIGFLNKYYEQNGSKICVIYGQKGVGKTTLLRFYAKQSGSFYYFKARSCSEREQRIQWGNELKRRGFDLPEIADFDMLLEASRLASGKEVKKHIIVIDEFQNLIKNESSFMHKLMDFMHYHQSNLPCMVLLCSSASGWIENNMLTKIGDFAGAINGLLKVKELKFTDMRKIYPSYQTADSLFVYSVLGGYPGLWNCFDFNKSVRENIMRLLIDKNGALHTQLSVFMAEELRETSVYNTILSALADGNYKLNDIYHRTQFSRAKISVYLKNLMELDLVEKVYSFESAGYRNTQKGVYCISNPYVLFYYKYIFNHMSELQMMSPDEFYEKYIDSAITEELEKAYCKICREFISINYRSVDEWHGKSGSIPIIALDEAQRMTVCFCSYTKKISVNEYQKYQSLIQKARIKPDTIVLFGEMEFEPELLEITKHSPVLYQKIIT